jgi:hypothetical protein
MKKHRKPISTWENTVARKCAVIALVAISPIWIILQIVWCIITHGVPEAWDNTLELFRADTIDSIKEAWIGATEKP